MGGQGCRKVALGSLNPVKRRGVEGAYRQLGQCAEAVPAEVKDLPPQPVGLEETLRLACLRAQRAREAAGLDEGVGVEAGLVNISGRWLVVNVACVQDREGSWVGLGPSFEVPAWAAERSARSELDRVVEEVAGVRDVGSSVGLIGLATGEAIVREDLVRWATLMALSSKLAHSFLGRLSS